MCRCVTTTSFSPPVRDTVISDTTNLKSLADAVGIRNKILSAFEQAEAEEDVDLHRDLLTFVLVGAGPTGVEMAAALAIFVRTSLRSEFRRIDPTSARIVLIDAARNVL